MNKLPIERKLNYSPRIRSLTIMCLLLLALFNSNLQVNSQEPPTPIKNVIIMIGDGMGFEHGRYGSLVEYGTQNGLSFQNSSFTQHQIWTAGTSDGPTDSAASATAIATGYKTRNGYVGIDENKTARETILEYAESLGLSTGLITTTEFNHGTPAGFGAHVDNREDWELINRDLYENNIEVLMGGGSAQIITDTLTSVQAVLDQYSYTHILTKSELQTLNTSAVEKLLATFTPTEFDYEANMDPVNDVHFADMILPALNILDNNENGFFAMFEQGHIDKAGHAAIASGPLLNPLETIEFDEGIKLVMEWMISNPDTLLIVTADHETGGLDVYNWDELDIDVPANYANEADKQQRRLDRAAQVSVHFSTSGHTDVPVPLHLYGKNVDLLISDDCIYNNAHVFQIMKNALDGTYPEACPTWIPGNGDTETGPSDLYTLGYISDPFTPMTETSDPSDPDSGSDNGESGNGLIMLIMIILLPIFSKLKRRPN